MPLVTESWKQRRDTFEMKFPGENLLTPALHSSCFFDPSVTILIKREDQTMPRGTVVLVKLTDVQLIQRLTAVILMESENLLLCIQYPTTGPYPDPAESS